VYAKKTYDDKAARHGVHDVLTVPTSNGWREKCSSLHVGGAEGGKVMETAVEGDLKGMLKSNEDWPDLVFSWHQAGVQKKSRGDWIYSWIYSPGRRFWG
jgi:hypothetical protein